MLQSERQQQLQKWCDQYFNRQVDLKMISGDASFRKYFRIQEATKSWIVADAPPETEKNAEFVHIAHLFKQANITAPEVLASDLERGFLIISDLGDETLLTHLAPRTVDDYYAQCMRLLFDMQLVDATSLPKYDQTQLIDAEMALFPRWFVERLLAYSLSPEEHRLIDEMFTSLSANALEQPQVFVHRDFHSRNLMLCNEQIAVIDFQDAVQGALTYDLVSLLRDCYIAWPQERVYAWLGDYYQQVLNAGLIPASTTLATFKRWFDWMGLQRHLKVLGIFARLSLRDNKHAYLLDLPLVIRYTRDVLALYPEQPVLARFLTWFDQALLPRIQQQSWIEGR